MESDRSAVSTPMREILDEAVRLILTALQPHLIILFGSAARGNMGPYSDLDFLIIMPDGVHRRKAAQKVSRALFDLGMPKDIVVVTESDVRSYGANPSLVIASALAEGRELYQVSYHPKKWIIRLLKPVNHEKD